MLAEYERVFTCDAQSIIAPCVLLSYSDLECGGLKIDLYPVASYFSEGRWEDIIAGDITVEVRMVVEFGCEVIQSIDILPPPHGALPRELGIVFRPQFRRKK